jgi:predicted SAM-dependent methyltransferase
MLGATTLQPLRIIIGAGKTRQEGWISTNRSELDLLQPQSWERFLRGRAVDALLAEHVWHYLNAEEALFAARVCVENLAPSGYLRIAVPDGFHPDPAYIEWVKPNGTGPSAPAHKVLYNYRSLTQILEAAGFSVTLLEYFDEPGVFHRRDWDPADGFIRRSARFDARNAGGALHYTSLLVDAKRTHERRPDGA